MAKVTSKRQVTIPKGIADRYRIKEGDDIEFVAAGDVIRVVPAGAEAAKRSVSDRLELFDAASARQEERQRTAGRGPGTATNRGWTREGLYDRGHHGRAG